MTLLPALFLAFVSTGPQVHAAAPRAPEDPPAGVTPSDWEIVRAVYESGRHNFIDTESGIEARNPGQRLLMRFDGHGFLAKPESGDWRWGLDLARWGRVGAQHEVTQAACARFEGRRLTYEHDDALSEWFVNEGRGLEHGFTVHARPAGDGELTFTLGVLGGLTPHADEDGRGASFVDASGVARIHYAGLLAFDADGQPLAAQIAATADTLVLSVDDRTARYPLTIDPLAQQAYLKASNPGPADQFGYSVAIDGDTLAVGAPYEDSNGFNGQFDNSTQNAGAVYVFVRSGATWTQQAYLKAPSVGIDDYFGWELAISGDTLVVGVPSDDGPSNTATNAGAMFIFIRTAGVWGPPATRRPTNYEAGDGFGGRLDIDGDTIVASASAEDSGASGVNGNQFDNSLVSSGAAYVFVRNGALWDQQAYLKASNPQFADHFGSNCTISGDTIAVAAFSEDSSATGVNGNQSDNSAVDSGAVYVFVRSGTTWSQEAYLKASNTGANDSFGGALALSGETLVVGAEWEDSNAVGVNGNQSDNSASGSGAAYVFVRNGSTWSQQAYLKSSNTAADDLFGGCVDIWGDNIVVGALGEDSSADGVDGDQSNNSASGAGAAYVFTRTGTTWTQRAYLKASNSDAGDWFGHAVAIDGETIVVGADLEASAASGVDGNQASNGIPGSGAAYVFLIAPLANDDCLGAVPLAIPSVNAIAYTEANLELASVPSCTGPEPGRTQNFVLTRGVWYSLNSPVNQTITVHTLAGAADTKLWVYDGSAGCGALVCVTANDDIEGDPFRSKLAFTAVANTDYYVLLAPYSITPTSMSTVLTIATNPTPANDDCAAATTLIGPSGSIVGTTVGATGINQVSDAGNPSCQSTVAGTGIFDVWHEFTAPCSSSYTFSTCGSYDTILSVHASCPTAAAANQLTPTSSSCSDDGGSGCTPGSRVIVNLTIGVNYRIRVVGKFGGAPESAFTLTWAAADSDGDGFDNCLDGCPNDPAKIAPGVCGCGVSDADTDGDGVLDCNDGCPSDPNKVAPGVCGCGAPDLDSDGDGVLDCNDGCPNDPSKLAPGVCGCGVSDVDSDGDGTADCIDGCPGDPSKIAAGQCGCGIADTDSDGDGAADCIDACPDDPNKIAAGQCGCGVADTDSDGDGAADCIDACPSDPAKTAPGVCGCGVSDLDSDGDTFADCVDNCAAIANPLQADCDLDGIGDACEFAALTQWDVNNNGVPDQCEACPGIVNYCTPGTTTNGCLPTLSASGSPSVAATSGFILTCNQVEGQKTGLLFYGITGPKAGPWAPGSTSLLCVKSPTQRMPSSNSGGIVGACDGALSIDWLSYLSTHPGALAQPMPAGQVIDVQAWFRDPPAPGATSLSDGLQFVTCP